MQVSYKQNNSVNLESAGGKFLDFLQQKKRRIKFSSFCQGIHRIERGNCHGYVVLSDDSLIYSNTSLSFSIAL